MTLFINSDMLLVNSDILLVNSDLWLVIRFVDGVSTWAVRRFQSVSDETDQFELQPHGTSIQDDPNGLLPLVG